jgi:SPP1 family holin
MEENKELIARPDTIARTIVLAIALVNAALALMGLPALAIEEPLVYEVISGVFVISAAVWAWWKNNSFTKEAQAADEVMLELKKHDN